MNRTQQSIEAKSTHVGSTAGQQQLVILPQINVAQTGFLYIYLSYDNQAGGMDVYFDELKITYTESPVAQVNAYYPYGMTAFSWVRSGEEENKYLYQGKEYNGITGLHDFHARQWDGSLGRWFAADPMNQFSSPYLGMGNNPVMVVDPDGNEGILIALGAMYGALYGSQMAVRNRSDNPDLYLWGGAVIGGLSAYAGSAISAAGGSAMAAGAASGAISGTGFSGLESNWNGGAMLEGGLTGAAGGFVGGGVGSAIGGGAGAFFGGAASSATSQYLSTGQVDWQQAGTSAAFAFGLYHGVSYLNYFQSTVKDQLSYRQFSVMQADMQRSRFWRREYGGVLLKDGSVWRYPKSYRNADGVGGPFPHINDTDVKALYHTHWGKEGKSYYALRSIDMKGNLRTRGVPSMFKNFRGVVPMAGFQNSSIHLGDLEQVSSYVITPTVSHFNPTVLYQYSPIQGSIGNPFLQYFPMTQY
jgi:RHS repeat-associated protein